MELVLDLSAAWLILSAIVWLSYDVWQYQSVAEAETVASSSSTSAMVRSSGSRQMVRMGSGRTPGLLLATIAAATVCIGALAGLWLPL